MDHAAPRTRTPLRASVSITLVFAMAGLLFTANARLARSEEDRHPENLAALVKVEAERVEGLQQDVDGLRIEVDDLADEQGAIDLTGDRELSVQTSLAAGAVPVFGDGLVVTLDDAPPGQVLGPNLHPDNLVVHQQDLEAVINALWSAGAEAMMLQDQRVLSTTAFRCVGNVLSLHGRVYSPPYRVQAIGDPAAMRAALAASPEIDVYREWVAAVGLGWSVADAAAIEMPAGTRDLNYATVPKNVIVEP